MNAARAVNRAATRWNESDFNSQQVIEEAIATALTSSKAGEKHVLKGCAVLFDRYMTEDGLITAATTAVQLGELTMSGFMILSSRSPNPGR